VRPDREGNESLAAEGVDRSPQRDPPTVVEWGRDALHHTPRTTDAIDCERRRKAAAEDERAAEPGRPLNRQPVDTVAANGVGRYGRRRRASVHCHKHLEAVARTESGKTVERRSLRRGPLAVRTTLSQASAHDTVSRSNDEMELTSPCDTNGRDAYPVGAAVAVNVSTKDVRRSSRVRRHAG